jgi:hypothetical protein
MIGSYFGVYLSLPEGHMEAVGAHGLDVSRPLVDQHDIEAGIREVGRDATSVRASTENCDFLVHDISKAKGIARRRSGVIEKGLKLM